MTAFYSPPARIAGRQWAGLAMLALPTLLISIDMTALALAVPALSADLRPSGVELLWITDVYGFAIAAFLVTMGTLGDRIGRRRLLLIGAAAFGLASILAAFSVSPLMLMLTRAALGVAGATLMPSTLALLRDLFTDEGQRTFAISVWMTSFLAGTALGPLVGGVMLEFFWWGSVFLIAVPVMVLLLIAGPFLLPESRSSQNASIDAISVLQMAVSIVLLVFGIKQIAAGGDLALIGVALSAGAIMAVLFVRRQQRLDDPLLDLRLFADRVFSTAASLQMIGVFATAGVQFLLAQYLQLALGLSPLAAGLWTLPGAIAGIVSSLSVARLVRGIRPARVLVGGLATVVIGLGLVAIGTSTAALAVIVTGSVLMSFGFAPAMALSAALIVNSVPAKRAGAASAVSETGGELGVALGIAVLGSVALGVYRTAISTRLPDDLPPEAADAASNTIGGAFAAADGLDPQTAAALVSAAQEAFTLAQISIVLTGAALITALAVTVGIFLRHLPASTATTQSL